VEDEEDRGNFLPVGERSTKEGQEQAPTRRSNAKRLKEMMSSF
jgi:hypothetical protein